ncbi:MAG: helix-turn-helix domain-containing protein [Gemmatimonas sp.]
MPPVGSTVTNIVDRLRAPRPTACDTCTVRDRTFCSVLSADEIARIRATLRAVTVDTHTTLFAEGEPAAHLFNVTSGTVKTYKLLPDGRRQITGFAFAGDFLGVTVDPAHAYSAEAVTPATLCRFDRARLMKLVDEMPHMEKHIAVTLAHELVLAQDQMLLLGRKTAKERIASFLMMLLRRREAHRCPAQPEPRPVSVALPMSRADIGDYLGLTIETVSRTLTQLRRQGVIGFDDATRAEVLDRRRLEIMAQGSA